MSDFSSESESNPSIGNTSPKQAGFLIEAQPLPDDLQQALKELDNPGDFHTGGQCILPLPGLKVKGVPDTISLPLTSSQAEQLASVAKQSPHGRGMRTVVDTSVRDCLEIDPSNLTFTNPSWEKALKQVADKAVEELGMPSESVHIGVYKLLLYKEGGHFKLHKDTEKEKGMFATLTVQLPSFFGGGEFIVRHRDDEKKYNSGADDGSCERNFYYTAFFADVEHELLSIDHGYRIVLVYNLNWSDSGVAPCADQTQLHLVKSEMENLEEHSPGGAWILAFGLGHEYTLLSLSGLGVDALKGEDRTKIAALTSGAKAANIGELEVLLVILQGTCEECDDDMDGYSSDSDVCRTYWGHIKTRAAFYANGRRCDLDLRFINWNRSLRETLTFKVKERGAVQYTGNEGATRETTYGTTAVVLWPKSKEVEILGDEPANLSSLVSRASVNVGEILDHVMMRLENQTVQDNQVAWQQLQIIFRTSLTNKFVLQTRRAIDLAALLNGPKYVFPVHLELIRAISSFGWEQMSTPMTNFLHLNMASEVHEIETRLHTLESIGDRIPQDVLLPSVGLLFEFVNSKRAIAPHNVRKQNGIYHTSRTELWGMFLRQVDHIHNTSRDTKDIGQIKALISRLASLCGSLDLQELDDLEIALQQRRSIPEPDPLEVVTVTVKETFCSLLMKRFQSEVNHIAKTKSLPTGYNIRPESSWYYHKSDEDWIPFVKFVIRVLSTKGIPHDSEDTFQTFLSAIPLLSEHRRKRLSVALSDRDDRAAAEKICVRITDAVMEKELVEKVRSLEAATKVAPNNVNINYTVHNLDEFPTVRSFLTSNNMEVTLRGYHGALTARKILASLRKRLPDYIGGEVGGTGNRSYIRLWKPFRAERKRWLQYEAKVKVLGKARSELNGIRSRLHSSQPNAKRQKTENNRVSAECKDEPVKINIE